MIIHGTSRSPSPTLGKFVGGDVSRPVFFVSRPVFFVSVPRVLIDAYDCCVHHHSFVLQYIYIAIGWWVHETTT